MAPLKGAADDGKRSGFMDSVDVLLCFSERREKERVWERKGLGVGPRGSLTDEGKRSSGGGRCIGILREIFLEMGGGP